MVYSSLKINVINNIFRFFHRNKIMDTLDEPTSLQSICHLGASELFPKHTHFESDDPSLSIPFKPLSGEFVVALGRTADGILALSNYRLYLQLSQACYNIPLGVIEQLEVKEIFFLHIGCKDARSVRYFYQFNPISFAFNNDKFNILIFK